MKIERTKNAVKGIAYGALLKSIQMLLPFFMRSAMIYFMGVQYLGLNSLFTSVLQVLNLAELGVGSAMVFSMYKPIATGDQHTICALMRLYKIYYRIIGTVIAVVGVALTPLIPKLINGEVPADVNVHILYLLNLSATVLTYWLFAYRNCLLQAHQRMDITNIITALTTFVQYLFQFVILLLWKNYYYYVITVLVTQAMNNVITAIVTIKIYPQYIPVGKLAKSEVKIINQRVRDLFTGKIGGTVLATVDTLVISAFLGLTVLAVYQNYSFIMVSIRGFIEIILMSTMAGLGNAFVTENLEKNFKDFRKFTFMFVWLIGICTACFLCLYQPFIQLWMGEDLMLPFSSVVCLCVYFYVYEINRLFNVYKDAAGLWHVDRYRPLVKSILNLFLNIILVNIFGLNGVVLSTALVIIFVGFPWLWYNLFTKFFKPHQAKTYILQVLKDSAFILVSIWTTYNICRIYRGGLISTILVRLCICLIIPNALILICYRKTNRLVDSIQMIDRITKGKLYFIKRLAKR